MKQQRSPDRSRASGLINKYSPSKANRVSTKDRYIKQNSPSRLSQEQQFVEAKRILDMHINYLSRGCYYFFRDATARYDDEALQLLRNYRNHENSDQLVASLTQAFERRDATVPKSNSRSPVRTTAASVVSQDRVRASMQRDRGSDLRTDFADRSGPSNGGFSQAPKRSYEDLKQILGFSNRYTFDDVSTLLVRHIQLHGDLNQNQFATLFKRQFPEICKYANFSSEGQNLLDESLDCLFNLMDGDRDGVVDEEELVSGLRQMFASSKNNIRAGAGGAHIEPAALFTRMDADGDCKLYVSDIEAFVMPQLRQIIQVSSVGRTTHSLTLSEMTGNVSVAIMRRCDFDQTGFLNERNLVQLYNDDPVSYRLIEDLASFAPDFMDTHRQVINGIKRSGANSSHKAGSGTKLRQSGNQDLQGEAQQQVQQREQPQSRQPQPPAAQSQKQGPRNRNQNDAEVSPSGQREVIRGQPETMPAENLTIKRKPAKTKAERKGDCNSKYTAEQLRLNPMLAMGDEPEENKASKAAAKAKNIVAAASMQAVKNVERFGAVVKQDLTEEFKQKSFTDSRDKIINLSKKSGLRQTNALEIARDLRKILKQRSEFTFEEFKEVVIPKIERRVKSSITMQIYQVTMLEIFNLFDADKSGTVDTKELANCMAIMCGGSMSEKINAAFILFDENNSGTMSFDELAQLIQTVFNLVAGMLETKGASYGNDQLFPTLDYPAMAVQTAQKAFSELQVPMTGEINYQQFVQWITGENLYSAEELAALQATQPPSKSKFAQKKFNNAKEWAKRFLQEEEFVDHLMAMRSDCGLQQVSLVKAQMQFEKYKEDGIVDKTSFMREMRELIESCTPNMSNNQRMKMDSMLISLYTLFDIDKNGILKSDEIAAALLVLCKGSMASKIKFGIQIFSSTDTETDVKIRFSEFQTLIGFLFKLSLEAGSEVMLDYPLPQLAKETAMACFEFEGITDTANGEITLNQVLHWLNKQSTLGI